MSEMPKAILAKICEAKEKQLKELDLSGVKLTQIPAEVFELTQLEVLNLSYNQLTTLPNVIAQLQNLISLDLSINQLTTLPDPISQLQNLTSLDLSNNQLTTLPDPITQLQNLTSLDLSYNKLTTLPDPIAQLQNLTSLDLNRNHLTTFPEAIAQLQNLTSLDLRSNQLITLPNAIAQLQNLISLDLRSNQLITLPDAIAELHNLTSLGLVGNPIETPPPEVVNLSKKGDPDIEKIKNYFRQLVAEGKDTLYEAKLLIVGEGGAGKTTLAKKIEDAGYQLREDEVSTKGIEVIRWEFPFSPSHPSIPPKGGEAAAIPPPGGVGGGPGQKTFRVNIWDFGGQEIYHATHQFFLTKRSLYALVADSRKEDTDFYYWLNIVELLSDNSPLLIVLNEKQDRHRDINERQLRGQFTNLKETLAANLATNRGLVDILSQMKHYLSHLPHIGTELPKTWVKVREALENDPRNYISLEAYLDICRQNGFQQLKDSLQLSGYLHDLGVCLHFQADPLLKKTVILKPEWGTAAVYKVLDDKTVMRNLGRFNRADLETIWHEPTYTAMQDELLQLMINFKLCYQIPGSGDYIAPQLLSANQPHYDWPDSNNLILRYTYDFMPKGILTQFIVAMHPWIADQRYVWKSGMILEKDRTRAEVIERYDRREIRVRITGQHKKELLTIVTYELDKIHDSYRRLKVNKLIPCNCAGCKEGQDPHFYPLEVLKKFTGARQEQIQCQKSFQMVNVWSLIDDVLDKTRLMAEKRELGGEGSEWESRQEHLLELIDIQTRKLRTLQVQRAKYGLDVPSHIVREIEEVEAELKRLEAELQEITPA
ncbi:MAG: leucine-rich repeat domain-containing protein [Anaerolineales bacterium]|nr:leucine-rich repeat domain-containing protein [Anaerolineales bacterium]